MSKIPFHDGNGPVYNWIKLLLILNKSKKYSIMIIISYIVTK